MKSKNSTMRCENAINVEENLKAYNKLLFANNKEFRGESIPKQNFAKESGWEFFFYTINEGNILQ